MPALEEESMILEIDDDALGNKDLIVGNVLTKETIWVTVKNRTTNYPICFMHTLFSIRYNAFF